MESPSTSERAAAVGGDNERVPLRDGVRVDGEWEHERILEGESGRRPVRTGMF